MAINNTERFDAWNIPDKSFMEGNKGKRPKNGDFQMFRTVFPENVTTKFHTPSLYLSHFAKYFCI